MAHIQPVVNHPGLRAETQQEGQLGTEGFDFMSYLLGLQANPGSEWWQTAAEGDKAQADALEDALKSGRDAAMPTVADQLQNLLAVQNPTVPQDTAKELSTENAISVLSKEDLKQLSVADLLKTPPEQLQPEELKELVDKVWGSPEEVKSVKMEALTPTVAAANEPHTDATQHDFLRRIASLEQQGKKPEVTDSRFLRDSVVQVASGASVESSEQKSSAKSDKKETRYDSGAAFASLVNESKGEAGETSVSGPDQGLVGAPAHAKLMPQILPKVEELAQQGGGKVTVLLDPPDLGKLTIEVTTRGKNVELAIHADSDKTRAALEGGMADLKIAMQGNDLQLTRTEVHASSQSSFASMQFGDGRSNNREQSGSGQQEGYRSFKTEEQQNWSRNLHTENPVAWTRNAGRLDVRV